MILNHSNISETLTGDINTNNTKPAGKKTHAGAMAARKISLTKDSSTLVMADNGKFASIDHFLKNTVAAAPIQPVQIPFHLNHASIII